MSTTLYERNAKLLAEFDPNAKEKIEPWATYAPGRAGRAKFKTHATRGLALNSFARHWDQVVLYEWDGDRWVEVARKDSAAHGCRCQVCGSDTSEPIQIGTYGRYVPWYARVIDDKRYDSGRFVWRRNGRKIIEPLTLLFVCKTCYPRFR